MARPIYVPQADRFINFSDTASDDDIKAYIREKYPKPQPVATEPPPATKPAYSNAGLGALASAGFAESYTDIPGGLSSLVSADETSFTKASDEAKRQIRDSLGIKEGEEWSIPQYAAYLTGQLGGFLVPGVGEAAIASKITSGTGKVASLARGLLTAENAATGARELNLAGHLLKPATAIQGGALQAESARQDILAQREQGMEISPEDQLLAQRLNFGIGLSEIVPLGRFAEPLSAILSKVPAKYAPVAEEVLNNRLSRLVGGAAAEGAQEVVSGVASDLVELGVYNPDATIGDDIFSNAAGGAFAGSLIEGIVQIAAGRKMRGQRQLERDLQTERQASAADMARGRVAQAAETLRQNGVDGILNIEENESPEGQTRYTINSQNGSPIVDVASAEDAVQAVNLYKQNTGANVKINDQVAPKLNGVRIGNRRFPSFDAAATEHERLKADLANDEKFLADNIRVEQAAKANNVSPVLFKREIDKQLQAKRNTVAMFDRFFSAEDTKAVEKTKPITVKPKVTKPEADTPELPSLEEDISSGTITSTDESVVTEDDTPIEAEDTAIGAIEMPIEEDRVLPDEIIDVAQPVQTVMEPIKKELRTTATAENLADLQTELFGRPMNVREMDPDQLATYEAERDQRFPKEEVDTYYDASPTNMPPARTLQEAAIVGPNVKDYTPETEAWMSGVYTQLKNRVSSIVPGEVTINLQTLIDRGPAYLVRGQARAEATPDGIKSIVDLATGILKPGMSIEDAVAKLGDTLNHEIIHVLRNKGVIRPSEWKILSRAAEISKVPGKKYTYLDKARAVYTPNDMAISEVYTEQDAVAEEAVAEMYREWVKNKTIPVQQAQGLFNRITEFFRRIFQTLRNARHEDFFKKIESGEIAKREVDETPRVAATRQSASPAAVRGTNGFSIADLPKKDKSSSTVYLRRDYAPLSGKGKANIAELGAAFDAAFLKRFGRQYEITNPVDYKNIVNAMADEVRHQMGQAQSGVGWYDADIQDVFDELSKSFPILKDPYEGPSYQDLFTVIAGVMSNGMKAKANVELAAVNFAHYLRTGEFSDVHPFAKTGWNQRSNIMGPQVKMLNSMISDPRFSPRPGSNNPKLERLEKFLDFMFDEHSVKEINAFRAKHGTKSPAKIGNVGDKRIGMYAFGPKFGPFILNLNGMTDETVDSWASRSFYRHMGRSLNANGKMNDAPISMAHREAMKQALRDIATKTKLSSRDVQAVLWFYEKELYNHLGQRIPLEVFSDGAREFTRKYGTGSSRSAEPRTDRERAITGSIEEASSLYDSTPERRTRFSAAPAIDSEEFRRWFGGSQLVNPDGTPLKLYTGTSKDVEFQSFNEKDRGVWVTDDPSVASSYALENDSMGLKPAAGWSFIETNRKSRVIPLYGSAKNILDLSTPEKQDAYYKSINLRREDGPNGYMREQAQVGRSAQNQKYDAIQWGPGVWAVFNAKRNLKSQLNPFTEKSIASPKFSASPALDSEEFKKWFGDSKVVNPGGTPKVQYHGTQSETKFKQFDTGSSELGAHFGTQAQANSFVRDYPPAADEDPSAVNDRVYPVYLSVQNPLRLRDHGKWTSGRLARRLRDMGVITPEVAAEVEAMPLNSRAAIKTLHSALKGAGYDGIVYLNRHEGEAWNAQSFDRQDLSDADFLKKYPEAQDSYIVFDPAQVKSVFNEFNPGVESDPRFSAAPLPDYVQTQNKTLFSPVPSVSFKDMIFNYAFGHRPMTKKLDTINGIVEIKDNTMAALATKAAVVDKSAYITHLESLLNQKERGNFQRMTADFSATAALSWRRRASHLFASMMLRGKMTINFARPGDIQSATMKIEDDPDSLKEVFSLLLEPGPINPETGKPSDRSDIFRSYAVAKRGEWLRATGQTVPREITPEYIRETVSFVQREYPDVIEAYNKYQRFNKNLLTAAMQAGVISQAELGRLTNQMNYYGFIYEVYGDTMGPTSSMKTASKFKLRPYTGTQYGGMVNDPMFVMIQNAQFWVDSIAKNLASTKAFNVARQMGEARLLGTDEAPDEAAGEAQDVMYFSQNGVVKRFAVKDPLLVVALGSDDRVNVGKFWELVGLPTHLLRESITRDPGFMARNLMRDTVSAWITSGADFTPVISTLKGFTTALKDGASFKSLGSYGVVGSYDLAMLGPAELAATLRRNSMPKNVHMIGSVEGGSAAIRSLWNRLGAVSEASDAATRIAVYDACKAQGMSDAEAAMQAIELLDFTRRGGSQVLSILTKMIPFLNARIQGMDVLYQAGRSGFRYATGKSQGERDANIGKKFLTRGAILAAISVALEVWNENDEDYQQLDNYIKDSNLLVPLAPFGLKGEFLAMPKPFEAGLLFSTFPQQIYKTTTGNASMRENAALFWSQIGSTFGVNPIPQVLLPSFEVITNHDFYTGLPLISEGKARLSPELQYNTSTSQLAMLFGKIPMWYNTDTGRFEGLSPITVDNLISGYGGPMGTYLVQATSLMMESARVGPDRMPAEISKLPLIKSFFVDAKSKNPKVVTQAYEQFRIADEANRTMSRLRQMGDAEALADYVEENRDILRYKKYIFTLADRLNKLSAQERQIERDQDMTRDEKFAAMEKLRQIRIRLASRVGEINKELGR